MRLVTSIRAVFGNPRSERLSTSTPVARGPVARGPWPLRTAYLLTGDPHIAEDVLQNVLRCDGQT
jgi:hypothetical protein